MTESSGSDPCCLRLVPRRSSTSFNVGPAQSDPSLDVQRPLKARGYSALHSEGRARRRPWSNSERAASGRGTIVRACWRPWRRVGAAPQGRPSPPSSDALFATTLCVSAMSRGCQSHLLQFGRQRQCKVWTPMELCRGRLKQRRDPCVSVEHGNNGLHRVAVVHERRTAGREHAGDGMKQTNVFAQGPDLTNLRDVRRGFVVGEYSPNLAGDLSAAYHLAPVKTDDNSGVRDRRRHSFCIAPIPAFNQPVVYICDSVFDSCVTRHIRNLRQAKRRRPRHRLSAF